MTKRSAIVTCVVVAALACGGFLFWRQQKVSECRELAVAASEGFFNGDARLAYARSINQQGAEQCYRDGFLASPEG